jgi:hypothetical protein
MPEHSFNGLGLREKLNRHGLGLGKESNPHEFK